MNREEAVNLLKVLRESIPQLSPQEISLLQQGSTFVIQFKGLCKSCKSQVLKIAVERGLVFKEQDLETAEIGEKEGKEER